MEDVPSTSVGGGAFAGLNGEEPPFNIRNKYKKNNTKTTTLLKLRQELSTKQK